MRFLEVAELYGWLSGEWRFEVVKFLEVAGDEWGFSMWLSGECGFSRWLSDEWGFW